MPLIENVKSFASYGDVLIRVENSWVDKKSKQINHFITYNLRTAQIECTLLHVLAHQMELFSEQLLICAF